jgi:hypothetical protein
VEDSDVEEDLGLAVGAAATCSVSACGYRGHTVARITRQRAEILHGEYIHELSQTPGWA